MHRLSEHIGLGQVIAPPTPYAFFDPKEGCGCALGRAMISAGHEPVRFTGEAIEEQWPWLAISEPGECSFTVRISPLFYSVFYGQKDMADLIAQVRVWEDRYDDGVDDVREEVGDLAFA